MSRKSAVLSLFLIIFTGLGFFWWNYLDAPFETAKVVRGRIIQAVYATGSVEPVYWAKLSATIGGKVIEILADEGDKVHKDQPLIRLESRVEEAHLKELESKQAFLKDDLNRQKILKERNFATVKNYEKALSDYKEITASIKAQKNLLERLKIISPMEGSILKRDVEIGEYVNPGDIVMWIGQLTPLEIEAEVDEEDIFFVKPGQIALIKSDAFPGEASKGIIKQITPKGDPVNKSFRVRIKLPETTKLMIGMTVEINIITKEEPNALLVPKTAVFQDKIWIANGRKAQERKIRTGIEGEDKIQVLEGLSENDTILLEAPPLTKTGKS